MSNRIARCTAALAVAGSVAWFACGHVGAQDDFRFRSGVELVNVTVTVTDRSGHFVAGLTPSDFAVYDNEQSVEITHFSADRVPVSVGIVLDTSGSMAGDKIERARASISDARDLSPATASIADELSRQYSLGYISPGARDGRWHTIRVEVRDGSAQVRARRGYTAS